MPQGFETAGTLTLDVSIVASQLAFDNSDLTENQSEMVADGFPPQTDQDGPQLSRSYRHGAVPTPARAPRSPCRLKSLSFISHLSPRDHSTYEVTLAV